MIQCCYSWIAPLWINDSTMQRKLTPLQRLRKEFPYLRDSVLQNELDHVGGDIKLAIEGLKPPEASPPAIPEYRNPSESPNSSSSSIAISNSGSFSNMWNWQATPVSPTPSIVEWYVLHQPLITEVPAASTIFQSQRRQFVRMQRTLIASVLPVQRDTQKKK